VEPRKIHPKMMTHAFVKYRAFSGKSSLGCTFAKNLEAGNPPSLRKLQYAWTKLILDPIVDFTWRMHRSCGCS
jgi:hypothetical protein